MAVAPNQPSTNQTQSTPEPAGMGSEGFFNALTSRLMDQGGIISSTASNLEGNIQNAIGGIRESANLSNQRIESQYGRERGYMMEDANNSQISGRAAGSGGLMNIAALRELTSTTDKNLNDLAQRKEELILQNNSEAAGKIAELEIKTLEFRMNAQQKVFDNLLGLGNFGTSVAQEQRLGRAQNFEERRTINNIGLEFGVEVGPNDTLETITAKAAPFASESRRAELAKTLAETARIKADTNKILQDGLNADNANQFDLDVQASAYLKDPNVIGNDVSDYNYARIVNRAAELQYNDLQVDLQSQIDEGASKSTILATVRGNTTLSAADRVRAIEYVNNNWKEKPKTKSKAGQFIQNYKAPTNIPKTGLPQIDTITSGANMYQELQRRLGF